MTIDEAISHALEVAGEQQVRADFGEMIGVFDELDVEACKECAANHRQLAEWLTELKEARRLLKWAVEGFRKLGASLNDDGECDGDCLYCPINNHGNCLKWEYEAEALKLLNDEK